MIASGTTRAVAAACWLLAAAAPAAAQSLDSLHTGRLVRVETAAVRHEGTLVSVTPESLSLTRPIAAWGRVDTLTLERASVSRLWVVSSERQHTVVGLLIGGLIGGALGYVSGRNATPCEPSGGLFDADAELCLFRPTTRSGMTQLGLALGGVAGMSLGALIGWASVSRTWLELRNR